MNKTTGRTVDGAECTLELISLNRKPVIRIKTGPYLVAYVPVDDDPQVTGTELGKWVDLGSV